jgi:hypothetical protein
MIYLGLELLEKICTVHEIEKISTVVEINENPTFIYPLGNINFDCFRFYSKDELLNILLLPNLLDNLFSLLSIYFVQVSKSIISKSNVEENLF